MLRLKNLKVKEKLLLVFSLYMAFIVGIIITGYLSIQDIKSLSTDIFDDTFEEMRLFSNMNTALDGSRRTILNMLNTPDADAVTHYKEDLYRFTANLEWHLNAAMSQKGVDDDQMGRVMDFSEKWAAFKKTRDEELIPAIIRGDIVSAKALVTGTQQKRFDDLRSISNMLINHEYEEVEAAKAIVKEKSLHTTKVYLGIALAGLAIAITLLRLMSTDIAERIIRIEDSVKAIEEGRLGTRVLVQGRDEIASLAAGFNSMAEKLLENSVDREQSINMLEWNAKEWEKRTIELQDLNQRLQKAQEDVSLKNTELTDTVSELKDANQRLADARAQMIQAEKMASIGQLSAGVAHEINNPVGFVSSNLNMLAEYSNDFSVLLWLYKDLGEAVTEGRTNDAIALTEKITALKKDIDLDYEIEDIGRLIAESRDGLGRIRSIVSALKDFSHSEKGEMTECDINSCVENTVKIAWNEIKYRAELKTELGDIPKVMGRPQHISQVILNLLVNAAQAMPDGPEKGLITIKSFAENGSVSLTVTDTGCGITGDDMKRIFDPFFTTKPVGKGTGLGLSIAYGIIKDHHGSIDVKSGPGQGTTFTVTLPARQGSGEGAVAAMAEATEQNA